MDIRKIRHVTVLAAERNFARAAAKLSITQSALSHSIARLEEEIGLVLFDRNRSGAGALLTSAGAEFVERAEDLLISERGLVHELALLREGEIGQIAFGFSPMAANVFLRPVMLDLAKNHSALHVKVELSSSQHLLHMLLQEEIEFFVADTANIKPGKKLTIQLLARVHVGFYVRKGHELASRAGLKLADLKPYAMLAPRAADDSHARIRHWLRLSAADPLPETMTCDDLAILKDLALHSDAALLTPHFSIAAETAKGKLVELVLTDLRHEGFAGICLVSLAKRTLSPAAKMIIAQVEALLAKHRLQPT